MRLVFFRLICVRDIHYRFTAEVGDGFGFLRSHANIGLMGAVVVVGMILLAMTMMMIM